MKIHGNQTLGNYVNKYPFTKTRIHTVNIIMGRSTICSVTVPRYIWHMNIVDAINDYDKKYYNFKVNTFDQIVEKAEVIDHEDGEFKTLNIWIREYKYSPMRISSQG